MKVSSVLPTGVKALLFDSARRRRELEEQLAGLLVESGFSEVILPVIDYLDPYQKMSGAMNPKELYRFVDRDGEVLLLRADFTPMLARLIAPRLASLELPLKLFYRGDVLRYQDDHAGRQREFYQLGAEILGLPGEEGECLALRKFLKLLVASERHHLMVVLGFAGALDELLMPHVDDQNPSVLAAAIVRRERHVARKLGPAMLQVVERGRPEDPGALGEKAAARLERLDDLCQELDAVCLNLKEEATGPFPEITFSVDLAEFADQTLEDKLREGAGARAYYDGLVFRAFAGTEAEPVGGGGRYDRLFHSLDAEVTAAGFCVSVDRLVGRRAGTEQVR